MDAADAPCVASAGVVLSLAHKAGLQSSLPLLKKNYKFAEVKLFGRIQGRDGDYLIAIGIEDSHLASKKYLYCQDGVSWAQLPTPTAEMKATSDKIPAGLMLTGDIAFVYQLPAPPLASGEEDEAEGPKMTEEERLAVLVEAIEAETALAPVGALSMRPAGNVLPNPAFKGLDAAAAQSLSSYVLLNKPKLTSVLDAPMEKSADALATADSIVPKAAMRFTTDDSVGAVVVRNLLWPGAMAFCKPGTSSWGYGYFGTGEKNRDIAFMLP